jgi:hypothetical protein
MEGRRPIYLRRYPEYARIGCEKGKHESPDIKLFLHHTSKPEPPEQKHRANYDVTFGLFVIKDYDGHHPSLI